MDGSSDKELTSDVARVRRVLARELETINEYEGFAEAASDPQLKAFFRHLAAEEKEHVAEAVRILELIDAGQAAHLARPFDLGHLSGKPVAAPAARPDERPRASPSPAPAPRDVSPGPVDLLPPQRQLYGLPAPPNEFAGTLTVGSLKNRTGR